MTKTPSDWDIFKKGIKKIGDKNKKNNPAYINNHETLSKYKNIEDKLFDHINHTRNKNPVPIHRENHSTGKLSKLKKLDLHGHTIENAENIVLSFLKSSILAHQNMVQIITGKGTHKNQNQYDQTTIKSAFLSFIRLPKFNALITKIVMQMDSKNECGSFIIHLERI